MQETLCQTTDAGDTLSASLCRSLSIRQRMQTLYQRCTLSDSGCRRHSILHQTVDAGDTLSDSGCRSLSIRQRMQETLYQTADAEVSL